MSAFYRSIRERVGTSLLLMPSIAAIIRDPHGRVLLVLHPADRWGLPGGAIEPGESPSAAAAREVFEETGLRVRPTRIAGVVGGSACRVRYPNGDEVEYVVTIFDCEVLGGVLLTHTDETTNAAYFSVNELPVLSFAYPPEVFQAAAQDAFFVAAEP